MLRRVTHIKVAGSLTHHIRIALMQPQTLETFKIPCMAQLSDSVIWRRISDHLFPKNGCRYWYLQLRAVLRAARVLLSLPVQSQTGGNCRMLCCNMNAQASEGHATC